ncbi:MAG TPA: PA14 domain-containing protein [Candidatus Paceibacterota bacterium]|nr:PA14 domain-containing protein [Verrucomicrobiota bacterium]HSA11916.1 PA14 domain-containing protein [Candidatus Paceibacterota bacterium]
MHKTKSPPLLGLLLAVLALLAFGAVSLHAEDVVITATTDLGGTLRSCPPSCASAATTSSTYSTAQPAGVAPRKSIYTTAANANWEVQPTAGNPSALATDNNPGYRVYVTKGTTGSCPADLVVRVTAVSGCTLYDTNGVAQTQIDTPYLAQPYLNQWYPVAIISNTVANPRIRFERVAGGTGRTYFDEVRFQRIEPCAGVATQPGITGPLADGSNYVTVTGIKLTATNITVYANQNTVIASTNNAAGFSPSGADARVVVALNPGVLLQRGQLITASQLVLNPEGIPCQGTQPPSGPGVGSGGPKMVISLGCQKNLNLAGPIGTATPSPGTDTLYWVKADQTAGNLSATAPVGGWELTPNGCWQTISFNWQTDPCRAWLGNLDYDETHPFAVLESIAIGIDGADLDSGPYDIYIDSIVQGTNILADFEGYDNGTPNVNFANANATATPPSGYFLSSPMSAAISQNEAYLGTNSLRVQWQFVDNANIRWARLLMNKAPLIYPQVSTTQAVTMSVLVLPPFVEEAHKFNGSIKGITNTTPLYRFGDVTLGADVEGSGTYTYEWYYQGSAIGVQTRTYTKTGLPDQETDGPYTVTISDGTCTFSATPVMLHLAPAVPIITNQPVSTVVQAGQPANICVGATNAPAGGDAIQYYTWEKYVAGEPTWFAQTTAPCLSESITSAQTTDTANYRVIVQGSYGSTTSSIVSLLVVSGEVVIGTGDGLRGNYFNLASWNPAIGGDFANNPSWAGTPANNRKDLEVNFEWLGASPAPGVNADYFGVRWYGQVQPLVADTYTFSVYTGDGCRLWIDNVLVIDAWTNRYASSSVATPVALNTSKHDILLEFFESNGSATAKLYWANNGGSIPTSLIPPQQLYANLATWTPPAVAITAPANVTLPDPVPLSAAVTANNGIVKAVEFYNGTTLLNTDTTAPYSYSWAAPAGNHSVTAKVVYNESSRETSSPSSVTVVANPKAAVTIIGIVKNGDGTVTISYTGGGGASFTLLKSATIPTPGKDSWTAVGTDQSDTPGSFIFTPAGDNEFYTIRSN